MPRFAEGIHLPQGLQFGPDGKLYVTSYGTGQVLRFLADGTPDGVFVSLPSSPYLTSIAFDPSRNAYVAAESADAI